MTFFRNVAAVVIGLFAAIFPIVIARQLAFGHGAAVSPANPSAGAQVVVVIGWFAAAAVGTWLAARLAKQPTPGVVVCAWLFTVPWLSPGLRPVEFEIRLACAAAIAIGGCIALTAPRIVELKRRQLA